MTLPKGSCASRGETPEGYRLFNIGSSKPVPLMDFIGELEEALGGARANASCPLQPGDVVRHHADDLTILSASLDSGRRRRSK